MEPMDDEAIARYKTLAVGECDGLGTQKSVGPFGEYPAICYCKRCRGD